MKNNSAERIDKSSINVLYPLSFHSERSSALLGYPRINYPPKSNEREQQNSKTTLQLVRSGSKVSRSRDRC